MHCTASSTSPRLPITIAELVVLISILIFSSSSAISLTAEILSISISPSIKSAARFASDCFFVTCTLAFAAPKSFFLPSSSTVISASSSVIPSVCNPSSIAASTVFAVKTLFSSCITLTSFCYSSACALRCNRRLLPAFQS